MSMLILTLGLFGDVFPGQMIRCPIYTRVGRTVLSDAFDLVLVVAPFIRSHNVLARDSPVDTLKSPATVDSQIHLLAKHCSTALHQVKQSVKYLGRQRHGHAVACQKALARVNTEIAELIELDWWSGHGVSYLLRNFQETPKTSITASGESVRALVSTAHS